MVLALSTKQVPSSSDPAVITNFRKVLLAECQKRFEEDYSSRQDTKDGKEEIESADKVINVFKVNSICFNLICCRKRKRKT
jgi:hypothetical protein